MTGSCNEWVVILVIDKLPIWEKVKLHIHRTDGSTVTPLI